MNKEPMEFDISRPEQARWLAGLLVELQGYGVLFEIRKDRNIVYLTIQ